MKRGLSLLLVICMCALLCGLHCCSGEDCLYCAQMSALRRSGALHGLRLLALCAAVIRGLRIAMPRGGRAICPHTLFSLKVKLSD